MLFPTWRHGQGKSLLQSAYFFAFSPISTRRRNRPSRATDSNSASLPKLLFDPEGFIYLRSNARARQDSVLGEQTCV